MSGGSTATDRSDAERERAFYTELRTRHENVVPVVGAGLTIEAGAAAFPALVAHLITSAKAGGADTPMTARDDPFLVADNLAGMLGESWVQEQAAALYASSDLTPTPALRALAKVSSGLILTTNYDLAIEGAAAAIGRPVRSLTLGEFDLALKPTGDELLVLHLHGVADRPDTIVLTGSSYERIRTDDKAQLLLRSLGLTRLFVFIGHRLSSQEVHLRRDLLWAFEAASQATKERHLLIANREDVTVPEALRFKEDLEANAGIRVIMFADPDRTFQAAVRAAHVIAGPSLLSVEDDGPLVGSTEADRHYLPLPMADAAEVSTDAGQGAYIARVWQHGETRSPALDDTEDRLILEAGGGAGKSQELLQIARRSERPALVQTLRSFQVAEPWGDPGHRFVSGMHSARAVVRGIGRLTIERLREESYVFLLDGLDEVAAMNRAGVMQLLLEVAAAYPQHRYVVGSRPLPELREQSMFSRWTPMADMGWVGEYARNRGVSEGALEAALPEFGDVRDLVVIPVFAAAVVDRIYAGESLPQTALELICSMADDRTVCDSRIEADPDALRIWLDRLALAMQLAETTEISMSDLTDSSLHAGLDGITPSEQLLAEVAARALLSDATGSVRFPANVIKEARAARALLDAADKGLELLRSHVLVELEATDLGGHPIRAIRPSWVNTLELLLPKAPQGWRDAVAEYDPALVARSISTTAESAERAAAVETLWQTYVDRRVWLERGVSSGNGSGDADALVRLVRAGSPDGFQAKVTDALTDDERTMRGNALEVVPYILPLDEVVPVLMQAVTDDDSVVRRRAAAAGWALTSLHDAQEQPELMSAFVDLVADQANRDPDAMATETLISVAIDLASHERALQIALAAPPKAQGKAIGELVRRLSHAQVLEILQTHKPFQTALFHELVETRSFDARHSWSATDVMTLAHIMAENPEHTRWQSDAEEILKTRPTAAIASRLGHLAGDDLRADIGRLAASLTDDEITDLVGLLDDPSPEGFAAAGRPSDLPEFDGETVELARAQLARILEIRRSAPEDQPGHVSDGPDPEPRTAAGDADPDNRDEDSDRETATHFHAFFADLGVATAFNPETQQVSWALVAGLNEAARSGATLTADESVQLVQLLTNWVDRDLEAWLQMQWNDEIGGRVSALLPELTPAQLLRLAEFLPGPWRAEFGLEVLHAAHNSTDGLGARLSAGEAVAANAGEQVVRSWAAQIAEQTGDRWIDPVLVRLGDCDAEARMIELLARQPETLTRHPNAPDEEWISHVRCPSSAESLARLVKAAHLAGRPTSELTPVHRALDRCAGLDAPRIWEELSNDPNIPSAAFLYYERRTAINTLIDTYAPPQPIDTAELQQLVVTLVNPAA